MGFDPLELNVSPHHFAEHMEVIARWTIPCSLRDLDRRVRDRSLTRPLLAVTFDDGYRDNLTVACPALERSGIYATVFVTPGAQSGVREMWWDELTRLVMGRAAADIDEAWTLSRADDPTPSHARYRQLFDDLRRAPVASRDTILARLRAGDGLDSPARHPLLERDEIAKLDASPAIEVGAHTMTHPVLSALRPSQQFEEIAASRAGLEVILGRPPTSFAYPFGTPADYDRSSVRAVARAGFVLGCANFASLVGRGSPSLELPRILVKDWSGEEFERRLAHVLDGGT